MTWCPHVTVATIIEVDQKFLMVEEQSDSGRVINQPAGHLEQHESLIDAAIRETLEETGWRVAPTGLLGLSLYEAPNKVTYLRVSFIAKAIEHVVGAELDKDILQALWLTYDQLLQRENELRSPLVLQDIERYRKGTFMGLEMLDYIPLK